MAAAAESPAVESVDLSEAVAMISEAAENSVAPDETVGEPAPVDPEATFATAEPATPAEPAEANAEHDDAAPEFWTDEDRPAWEKVPAELRPMLRRYEQQRLDFVAENARRNGEERDEAMRVAQGAHALVEQAADWWRKNGPAFHQSFVDRWSKVDWKGLAEKDPAEVGRLMQQRQEEETLLGEARRRGEADMAAAQEQAGKEREEARRVEQGRLAARLPEWFGTPQVAERTWDGLRRYLFAKGVPGETINAVYQAPIVEIALNAMRFENAHALAQQVRQRSMTASGAARSGQGAPGSAGAAAPARVSPGPASRPGDRASEAVRHAADRFRRGGGASIEDAAELIRLSGL